MTRAEESVPAAGARAWCWPVLAACVLLGVAAVLTLLAPRPDPAQAAARCWYVIALPRGLHVTFGCDGFTFLRGAVEPSLLLEPTFAPPTDFTYQSRPLHIGLAAVLGRVLQPVAGPLIAADLRYQGGTPLRRFAGAYVAYVLINAGLLVAAGLALQDALVGWRRPTAPEATAWLAAAALVILNWTTRAWLFTPHTVLWGILVPLWSLAAGRRILAPLAPPGDGVTRRAAIVAGMAALAYPFTVLVPATALVALGRLRGRDGARIGRSRWLRVATVSATAFALPTLAWIGVSFAVSGGYYHHEAVAYRQFRWPLDALARGPGAAWAEAVARASRWGALLATQWTAPAVLLAGLAVASAATGGSLRGFAARWRALLESAGIVLVLGLGFWYLNGELRATRAAMLTPVVQVIAAALALDLDRRDGRVRWTALLAGVTIAWGVAQMLRPLA